MRTKGLISGPMELLFTILSGTETQYVVVSRSRVNKINKFQWSTLPGNIVVSFFVCRTGIIVSAYHVRGLVMVIKVWSVLIIKRKNGDGKKRVFLMSYSFSVRHVKV